MIRGCSLHHSCLRISAWFNIQLDDPSFENGHQSFPIKPQKNKNKKQMVINIFTVNQNSSAIFFLLYKDGDMEFMSPQK